MGNLHIELVYRIIRLFLIKAIGAGGMGEIPSFIYFTKHDVTVNGWDSGQLLQPEGIDP